MWLWGGTTSACVARTCFLCHRVILSSVFLLVSLLADLTTGEKGKREGQKEEGVYEGRKKAEAVRFCFLFRFSEMRKEEREGSAKVNF